MLPDVLGPGLVVVFCGTAPSPVSAKAGAYYAGPGNRFWPILHLCGLTPYKLQPREYILLPTWGLGLTDLVKTRYGMDRDLVESDHDVAGLWQRISGCSPAMLAFTSKQAARKALGVRHVDLGCRGRLAAGGPEIHVLPSTSGRAAGYWDEGPWHALARRVRDLRD
ncbi:MAG: mismatch-specific DNA-glycosylase [Candidatus Sericytochromatia bacterium]|nr:mismatch-specific DNA-glycosylase [Candidatus Sericytochromatia bacterium]